MLYFLFTVWRCIGFVYVTCEITYEIVLLWSSASGCEQETEISRSAISFGRFSPFMISFPISKFLIGHVVTLCRFFRERASVDLGIILLVHRVGEWVHVTVNVDVYDA